MATMGVKGLIYLFSQNICLIVADSLTDSVNVDERQLCVCVLHYSDQADVMSVLLQSGAHVNAVNSSLCSALHIAVNKQHVRCVQVLLRHGCDVNVQVRRINQ